MPDTPVQIYVVDDDREMRNALDQFLTRSGCNTKTFASGTDILKAVETNIPDVIVSDIRMPGMDGLELLGKLCSSYSGLPVVIITAHGDVPMAVDAMKLGAFNFIEKPFQPDRLLDEIRRAAAFGQLQKENRKLKERLRRLSGLDTRLIGHCADMQRLRNDMEAIGASDATVMVLGETGTGKEVVARALHELSPRADNPFIVVNCAMIEQHNFESTMFGTADGITGLLSQADTGSLFLDELAACPPETQAKLLRIVEVQEFTPIGSAETRTANIRLISASNRQLDEAIAEGTFRKDLYFRLNSVMLKLPPLREREEDIPLLFEHYMARFASLHDMAAPLLTADDLAALMTHDWPGNVRELKNVAKRRILAAMHDRGSVGQAIHGESSGEDIPPTLRQAVAGFERQLIAKAIQTYKGRMDAVAEALGIGRRTLNEKIVKLGLDKEALL